MLSKIFQNVVIGLALMVVFLILAGIYIYNGGTPSCVFRGYNRFDWTVERPDERFRMGDGTAQSTITNAILMPSGVKAFTAFKRVTMLDNCAIVDDLLHRISFVELRSPQLSAAVQAWRTGTNDASDFRAGTLNPQSYQTAPKDESGNPIMPYWDRSYYLENAPDWVEEQQLGEASFVAFWGSGRLFKGKSPDHYVWVGYF